MKALVIPAVRLQYWMFHSADKIINELRRQELVLPEEERQTVGSVCLGDLPDFGIKPGAIDLYEKTYDVAIRFVKEHPNTYFCIGNHDISYIWKRKTSGYSNAAEQLVREKTARLKETFHDPGHYAFVHCLDNTIFSHAGLCSYFVLKQTRPGWTIDDLIFHINHSFGEEELWKDDSPIWIRMQKDYPLPYKDGRLQVFGHTACEHIWFDRERGLLNTDNFFTKPDGTRYGDRRFIVVDTIKKSFAYADELINPGHCCYYDTERK